MYCYTKKCNLCIAIYQVMLKNGSKKEIWRGRKAINIVFDNEGSQLAFIEEKQTSNQPDRILWHYNAGDNKAAKLADNQSINVDGLVIHGDGSLYFSKNGNHIFFDLINPEPPKQDTSEVKVQVWSYRDERIYSDSYRKWAYKAVVSPSDRKIMVLERDGDDIFSGLNSDKENDDYILIKNQRGDETEYRWNKAAQPSIFLVSTKDGSRKLLNQNLVVRYPGVYRVSYSGKYVLYFNQEDLQYYSYEIDSSVIRNLTKDISNNWHNENNDNAYPPGSSSLDIICLEDETFIIYDNYDIWRLDPSGNTPPLNITNGYGRKCKIQFRIAYIDEFLREVRKQKNPELILTAFNLTDKTQGFYKQPLLAKKNPELLSVGPFVYGLWPIYFAATPKARDAGIYLVRRMSATEAPNLFTTNDFKTFNQLTNVQSQRAFNWLTAELITWRMFDGRMSQGVLYKPENFDPTKKYPVIFLYYEKKSQQLHYFEEACYSNSDINIPYMVSNGYLVFSPDIYYTIGQTGKSIYNSVVSAAQYLATLPFVDAFKMGLNGFSFGGYETNYLIANTNLFAAAVSGGGLSNHISFAGSTTLSGNSNNGFAEASQSRIGGTLWEKKQAYIEDSPIFNADKVTTPILLMVGKVDGWNLYPQNLEYFLGLRRLSKKAWMLVYEEEGHGLGGKNATDFTIRMKQFFDHYLKDAPPPKWMTQGIPAKLKGIDDGLELDYSIKTPPSREHEIKQTIQ